MNPLPAAVYSAEQVRATDRHAIERLGISGYTLMTRAAESALDLLVEGWPAANRVLVLCGAGNNAGDGYVVARLARAAGLQVTVAALVDPSRLSGDAGRAHHDWLAAGGTTIQFDPALLPACDVVVDALLGTGLDRPVAGAMATCIAAVNAASKPVLAIDLPSGIDADSGAVLGHAVRATRTITFVGLKSGLFLADGLDHVGRLAFADLGIPVGVTGAAPVMRRTCPSDVAGVLPRRRRGAHKGDNGRVLVVGGGSGMPGAVRLAAEAALRAGAGLVTVATRAENLAAIVGARPEIICHAVQSAADLGQLMAATDVIAVGPGLGQSDWARNLFEAVLGSDKPLVVDADALNLLSRQPSRRGRWVLTPHPGEAARLLDWTTAMVQADRLAALRALAQRYDGVTVLKGAGSLVLGPTGTPWLCDAGNPGMATAGMGDVLTGIVAAVAAQCPDLERAAVAGVAVHAAAGDRAAAPGERGLLATDVLDELRACVNPG